MQKWLSFLKFGHIEIRSCLTYQMRLNNPILGKLGKPMRLLYFYNLFIWNYESVEILPLYYLFILKIKINFII